METAVDVLVIGAGPFGLAVAAGLADRKVDHLVAGEHMGFWRKQMPEAMLLRSGADWHLDPGGDLTMEHFLASRGTTGEASQPLTRALYLDYVSWFSRQRGIDPSPVFIDRLDPNGSGRFTATRVDGERVTARRVVLALGMGLFPHIPPGVASLVPAGRGAHTGDRVDFTGLRDLRCLIVGGRQAAFEWAALIHEAGARDVVISHRHASPAFAESDWSWVAPLVEGMVDNPGWYRSLPADEQAAVSRSLWHEGRAKVEPWLEPRVRQDGIRVLPGTTVVACQELGSGAMAVRFDNDETVEVDDIIFATGYKVDIDRIGLLARGNLMPDLAARNGYPVLDCSFQTTVPGLYITSMAAGQDFGPFFGFTVAARSSARIISAAMA